MIEVVIGIIAVVALITAFVAFQSVQNWEYQMRLELKHLEVRMDSLMESIRLLYKDFSNLNKK